MANAGKRMRIGLAGAGAISENHLIAWAKLATAEVVAICDPDIVRAEERARRFGIGRTYGSLAEMIVAEDLDAVDIATPRDTHTGLALQCAEAGIAVLCQKPLAPSYEDARKVVAAIDGRIRLMVHENWRFRPYYRRVGALVREGELGRITQCLLSVHRSALNPDARGRLPWLERAPLMRTEPRLIIAESLIHHLDVVRWLLGPLVVAGATAMRACDAVTGEDNAALLLEGRAGEGVVVAGSMTAAGTDPRAGDRLVLIGTEASLVYERGHLAMRGRQTRDEWFDESAAYQASFDGAIAHFVHAMLNDEPFETDPQDNFHTLRLVEESYSALIRAVGGTGR